MVICGYFMQYGLTGERSAVAREAYTVTETAHDAVIEPPFLQLGRYCDPATGNRNMFLL
jgi:hypothetical protein